MSLNQSIMLQEIMITSFYVTLIFFFEDGIVGYMKMKVNHVSEELKTPEEFDAYLNELDNAVIGKCRFILSADRISNFILQKCLKIVNY